MTSKIYTSFGKIFAKIRSVVFTQKSNQIKWFIRYSSTDAGLQQYKGNVLTTNNITSSVSWQHNSSDKNN